MTQLALFVDAPAVDAGTVQIARGGLSHFREQLRRYGKTWPYLVPEWAGWIAYYECMLRDGFTAAERLRPRIEESEPSKMFAACTRRQVEPAAFA